MAAIDSSYPELIYAERFWSSKSPMAITRRAGMLKMLQDGGGRNSTDLRMVTL